MFNIRVYGVLLNEEKQVLVSDEFIRGNYYTKFPGGGLELGEGTRDCLKREFKEEMNLAVIRLSLFIILPKHLSQLQHL
jgi:8-oxo-dGTP diphosphatase